MSRAHVAEQHGVSRDHGGDPVRTPEGRTMPPTKVLARGYPNRRGVGSLERFSKPNEGFHRVSSNKAPNAPVPNTDNLGTWSLTPKGWMRHS